MDFTKWLEKNLKTIIVVFVVLCVGGGAIAVMGNLSKAKEQKAQENYYVIEKKYFDLKSKKEAPTGDKKNESIDFTEVKSGFQKVITDFPKSIASQMAALHLAQILVSEGKPTDALAVLKSAEHGNGLVSYLVTQQTGLVLVDLDKCSDAISVWQKLIDNKNAGFIHNELKMQQALCYSKTNNFQKAEEILTNLANQSSNPEMGDSATAKEAEKYLKLLKFSKVSGT